MRGEEGKRQKARGKRHNPPKTPPKRGWQEAKFTPNPSQEGMARGITHPKPLPRGDGKRQKSKEKMSGRTVMVALCWGQLAPSLFVGLSLHVFS
jgi:hypothetical protein